MFVLNENERECRFGDSGPKYLMKGPRSNFAVVQFQAGQDFKAHYHNVMEENFFILEGEVDIVVDGVVHTLHPGDLIHIEPGEIHYVVNYSNAPVKMISTLVRHTGLCVAYRCFSLFLARLESCFAKRSSHPARKALPFPLIPKPSFI